MPKFLIRGSYTQTGLQGLLKEGGTGRRDAVSKMVSDSGGRVEAFYYAFGGDDVLAIVDAPDQATLAGMMLRIGASGAVETSTTVLLTPEEIDQAIQVDVDYRAPGA